MPFIPLMQVDAFTDRAFSGNPAAVCWLETPQPAEWMQRVAAEMNLSETAFVEPHPEGFGLRWFTPAVEVDLCGHATLASAHALEAWGRLAPGQAARFLTRSGWLGAQRQGEWIELDFPSRAVEAAAMPPGLNQALGGVAASYCGRGQGPVGENYLLELGSEAEVRAVHPDFAALARLPLRSLTITSAGSSAGTSGYDFVSRFFAPSGGVNEDPVTGSAHTQLAPYWGKKLGKQEMLAYQASARGGTVRVRLAGERVKLGGQAVTVFRAELLA